MPQFRTALDMSGTEDSENTDDSVKAVGWKVQGQHIRAMEGDIFQSTVLGFCPRQLQELIGQINSDNKS